MARNPHLLLLFQAFVACLSLALLSMGFATAWALFLLQEPKDGKRPAFNLREL